VSSTEGSASLDLSEVANADRKRFAASLAGTILAGGERAFFSDAPESAFHPVVVVVAILFGSWLLCITAGTLACAGAAAIGCGWGRVDESTMYCTGGRDESGNWKAFCHYKCKPDSN
jgi:hypothetical protein